MVDEIKWLKDAFSKKFNESGLTQRKFADKVGISQAHVNRLLNSPTDSGPVDVWSRIATAFGYTLGQFVEYGRSINEPDFEPPPAPDVAECLAKTRKLLEGPKANVVKEFISALSPDD